MDGVTLWAVALPGSGCFQTTAEETSMDQQGSLVSSGLAPSGSAGSLGLFLGRTGNKQFPFLACKKPPFLMAPFSHISLCFCFY